MKIIQITIGFILLTTYWLSVAQADEDIGFIEYFAGEICSGEYEEIIEDVETTISSGHIVRSGFDIFITTPGVYRILNITGRLNKKQKKTVNVLVNIAEADDPFADDAFDKTITLPNSSAIKSIVKEEVKIVPGESLMTEVKIVQGEQLTLTVEDIPDAENVVETGTHLACVELVSIDSLDEPFVFNQSSKGQGKETGEVRSSDDFDEFGDEFGDEFVF